MAIDAIVKTTWQNIQSKNSVAVNAIGVPIKKNDKNAMQIWKDEGIDKFVVK